MSEKSELELEVLFSAEHIAETIKNVAEQINIDYGDQPVHLIGVLRGAAPFLCELSKYLTMPVTIDFIQVTSYDGTNSGELKEVMGISESIKDKNVIIIEDIIDSGKTLKYLKELFAEDGPKSLKTCTLLNKPSRRVVEIEPDFCGEDIPDLFVVGYGLDYDQKYRNLPYIAILKVKGGGYL